MSGSFTIRDFIYWIQANKKGRAFRYYHDSLVLGELMESITNGVFGYTTSENGSLTGVCCGKKDVKTKSIFITDVLTTDKSSIRKLVERFLLLYPDYTIKALCRGRERRFTNVNKLKEKLELYGKA